MMERSGHQVTQLLKAWSEGEPTAILKLSPETVKRDWKFAKSWLRHELSREKQSGA